MPRRFVPATGINCLLPWYDPAVHFLTRQSALHAAIVKRVSELGPSSLLDVGCGSGTLAIQLKRSLPKTQITGCDVDPRILDQAKRKPGSEGIHWFAASADQLAQPPGSVQVIVSSLLMHHLVLHEKSAALLAMRKSLDPGGTLLLGDYGKSATWLSRVQFLPVQLVDGWSQTRDNVAGKLPSLMRAAGFGEPKQLASFETFLGTVRLYEACPAVPERTIDEQNRSRPPEQ